MSNIMRKFHQPERQNWKTSWKILKGKLQDQLKDLEVEVSVDRRQNLDLHISILQDLLYEMQLIEKGTSLP